MGIDWTALALMFGAALTTMGSLMTSVAMQPNRACAAGAVARHETSTERKIGFMGNCFAKNHSRKRKSASRLRPPKSRQSTILLSTEDQRSVTIFAGFPAAFKACPSARGPIVTLGGYKYADPQRL